MFVLIALFLCVLQCLVDAAILNVIACLVDSAFDRDESLICNG